MLLKKADFAVIVVVLAVLFIWSFASHGGTSASIYVNGKLHSTLPLNKEASVTIKSEYGKNTVNIKDGKVSVTNATCRDKLCEKSFADKSGQSIVCLPNRLSVVIEGGKNTNETDVIL